MAVFLDEDWLVLSERCPCQLLKYLGNQGVKLFLRVWKLLVVDCFLHLPP